MISRVCPETAIFLLIHGETGGEVFVEMSSEDLKEQKCRNPRSAVRVKSGERECMDPKKKCTL
jgi:hypothetical protein